MKARRRFARVLALVAALAGTLLLLIGTYAVIAGQRPSAGPEEDLPIAARSASTWSSEWITITAGGCETLNHNLAGDPNDYAVELWFKDVDGDLGIHRRYYGGVEENGDEYGAYWQNLGANSIKVCRGAEDDVADQIHIRVWKPPANPNADSDWMGIAQGQTINFQHNLNITSTELTVGLWFSSTEKGIHHYSYGGLADDVAQEMHGAHWHHLTNNTVQVTRHPQDQQVKQVRVIVVHGDSPDYDSLEAPDIGGWQPIARGTMFTFTHGLNWDPDLLLVRAECFFSLLGTHQLLAGGNHDWSTGWQGANLQNLTETTVQVYRQVSDQICPQVRVRIWRRGARVYLPLVLSSDAP